MKFKTILFDLDGTIADTLPLCIAAFKKSVQPWLSAEISEQEIIATFGPSEEGTIRKLIPEHEEAGVRDYLLYYEELHYTCPTAFAGIQELLEFLKVKKVQLAMVTGKGIHSTRISLKQFALESYFTIVRAYADGVFKMREHIAWFFVMIISKSMLIQDHGSKKHR
jgi:phosphoglycolate phosphatase-like HAD superfamily hydrolase